MAASQWSFKTAADMSAALAAKKVSAVELAQDTIARIERHDAKVNAVWCATSTAGSKPPGRGCGAGARRQEAAARHSDDREGSFNVAGLPTTWGYPQHKDFKPAEDALPIARIKDAGGVILGKTNVPLSLADWQSYNEVYGATNNP